jgi:hypothetical protein
MLKDNNLVVLGIVVIAVCSLIVLGADSKDIAIAGVSAFAGYLSKGDK